MKHQAEPFELNRPKRIMIIDECDRAHRHLEDVLHARGYSVTTTKQPLSLFSRVQPTSFDSVIVFVADETSSKQTLEYITTHYPTNRMILVSTAPLLQDLSTWQELNNATILNEPQCTDDDILKRLQNILGGRKVDHELTMEASQDPTLQKMREEKHLLEEQLLQAGKLAALGEMMADIMHELNNPLTSILGLSQLLAEYETVPDELRDNFDVIVKQTLRIRRIVRNFMKFIRKQKTCSRSLMHLNELITETTELLEYELKLKNITINFELADPLPMIEADAREIQQVIVNLLINAAYAVAKKKCYHGSITISTKPERRGKDKVGYVLLTVSDTGVGIPLDQIAQIFTPLFTTKAESQGTGLGLSISKQIVEAHNGTIDVESHVGEGTTFFIHLPASQEKVPKEKDTSESKNTTAKRHEVSSGNSVLVIDDEEEIVALVSRYLSKAGYQVDTVFDAESAYPMIQQNRHDIIITDVRMPGLNGMQLYKALLAYCPENNHRVIFMSGDTVSTDIKQFAERYGIPFLEKPFDLKHMLDVVQHGSAEKQPTT